MAPKISISADQTKEKISYAASTDPINCYCGVLTVVRLSKTAANPNRPFHGCRNWNRQSCGTGREYIRTDSTLDGVTARKCPIA
ncbi:hypothetical protein LINPERHAP2_LOCUS30277 [Linum perenne]